MLRGDPSSLSVRDCVSHHPWIHNRFAIRSEYHQIGVPRIIRSLEKILQCVITLESYDFDLNGAEPILCLWLDCERNIISRADLGRAAEFMWQLGFRFDSWWEREKDCTRISIWRAIPESISAVLMKMEMEWRGAREGVWEPDDQSKCLAQR